MNLKIVLIFIALLYLSTPVSASLGSDMVAEGMKVFANSIGDSMISLGTNNETVVREATPGLIFTMITYTVNPYEFTWVKKWWNTMLVFYVFVLIIACVGGAAMVMLHRMSPDSLNRIEWLMGGDMGMTDIKGYLGRMVLGLIFPLLTLFGVYVILVLNTAVSGLITANALNAVPPTIDNMVAYFFMAIAYLVLAIVFALRNVIIVLFAAGSLGLAALYLIPQLQDFVKSIFVYFIIIVFMQPALIFVAAVGTIFIQNMPLELAMFTQLSYLALIILLVVMAVACIIGTSIVSRIIGVATIRRI